MHIDRHSSIGQDIAVRTYIAKLQKATNEAIADPGVSEKLKALAVNPGGATPEQFQQIIANDTAKFAGVVKAANLKFED